ncbi:MAG: hypothetical protein AAF512_07655 [Pseudomonadota bacterium]
MNISTYLAGCAQLSLRGQDSQQHPAQLMAGVATTALQDAGLQVAQVDLVACVEPLSCAYNELAGNVAQSLGCRADINTLWVPAGGTSPQDLLHQIGVRIAAGELDCAIIAGSEAFYTRKRARKAGIQLDWPERPADYNPMRGQGPFTSELERRHGLMMPIQLFPLFENALRHTNQRTAGEQISVASTLLARNAQVAINNPHAWFQDGPTADDIGTVSDDNRMIAYPYTKRMNAIMDVDQAAALVLVSERLLKESDLADNAAAVLGGCGAEDIWNPIERRTFAESPAMTLAIQTALAWAGISANEVNAADLYSCFPSAVQLGLIGLGVGVDDPRPVSLTGGLAYAGGPGNAYVLHSLATALLQLRQQPQDKLLVTGIGMANTKHAATVLSHAEQIPTEASGEMSYREPLSEQALAVEDTPTGQASIVTYTIEYDRQGTPTNVIYILDVGGDKRSIANAEDPATAAEQLLGHDPIGRQGAVRQLGERNVFELT